MITTAEGVTVFESYDTDADIELKDRAAGTYTVTCLVPGDLLASGQYLLSLNAGIPNVQNLAFVENVLTFHITDTGSAGSEMTSVRRGLIRPRLEWSSEYELVAA